MIAGVAAGIAQRYGWDPTLVRLAFVLSLLLPGPQFILYLAAWVIIPEEPAPELHPHYQGPPVPPRSDTPPPPGDALPLEDTPPPADAPLLDDTPSPGGTPPPGDTPPLDDTPPPPAPPSAG